MHLAAAVALTALAICATWPVWDEIFRYAARNEEQSHSFFAAPIAAWLVWVRRERLKAAALSWSPLGVAVVAAGWAMLVLGFRAGVHAPQNLGAVLVVIGAAYAALGRDVFVRLLPAVGALLLVLPVPGRVRLAVAGPLQEASAHVAAWALDLLAVPVARSGSVLTVNGVDVGIAEACNGMRMVTALAVVSYAFVFSSPLRPVVRVGILTASPFIALLVNFARLVPTALAHGYAAPATADAVHEVGGWAALLLALAILLGITNLLRWLELPIDDPRQAARAGAASARHGDCHPPRSRGGATDPPATGTHGAAAPRPWPPAIAGAILVSMLLVGGFDAKPPAGLDGYLARIGAAIDAVPYRLGNAVGVDESESPGVQRILRPDALLRRRYTDVATGDSFNLIVVHCTDARDLLGHYPPVCYPSAGWSPDGQRRVSLSAGAVPVPACFYGFRRRAATGEARTGVLSFFILPRAQGGVVADMAPIDAASRSTTGTALGASHVMLAFSGTPDDRRISQTAAGVLAALEPMIRTTLEGTRGE